MNSNAKIEVVGNYSPSNHDASRIVNSEGVAPTVKENHGTVTATTEPQTLRIRKLTPKECWRLMGFTDADFETGRQMSNYVNAEGGIPTGYWPFMNGTYSDIGTELKR